MCGCLLAFLLTLAQFGQNAAEVGPGFGMIFVQLNRHEVSFPGGWQISQPIESFCQIETEIGSLRRRPKRSGS